MYKLIKAVEFAHSKGIVHLDIKPKNVIVNQKTQELNLIDFGISQFVHSGGKLPNHIGTLNFEAPEMLMDFSCYDFTADSWALGSILGGMMFKTDDMFMGASAASILADIMQLYDVQELESMMIRENITMGDDFYAEFKQLNDKFKQYSDNHKENIRDKFVDINNIDLVTDDGLDLIS